MRRTEAHPERGGGRDDSRSGPAAAGTGKAAGADGPGAATGADGTAAAAHAATDAATDAATEAATEAATDAATEAATEAARGGAGPSTTPVVRVEGVSRWFGSVVAVSDVTFDVFPGITGLLGPNGAGKTTLLRMMSGLARVSGGRVTVFGEPIRDNPPLYGRIGVMSEHETVYGFMKGRDFVRMMGKLRGVERLDEAVERAIAFVDLLDAQHRPMRTYSRGMRQRMRLAATLVHDPELLILDEPLNGADPRQRVHFQELLHELAAEGRTIVISSHILEEVEQLAQTVLLVVNGKLAASGGFRAIRAALNERPYHVRVLCDAPRRLASGIVTLESVDAVNVDPGGAIVVLSRNVRDLQIELPRLAQAASIRLRKVEPLDDSLESVFGYLVER